MNFKKSFQMSPEMRNILPVKNERKQTKNFLIENKKNIRQMQLEMEAARSSLQDIAKKYQKPPKKKSPFTIKKPDDKNKWIPVPSSGESTANQPSCTKSHASIATQSSTPLQYSDRGVQTSPPPLEEREERSECRSTNMSLPSTTAINISVDETTSNMKERAINKMLKDTGVNYVELNRRRAVEYKRKTKEKSEAGRIPSNYQLGALPRYLKERKSINNSEPKKNEPQNESSIEIDLDTPAELRRPGHILLSDEERLEHLKIMKKCYEELLVQFNQLPIRSDSLKSKQKKAEMEKQLENLEKSMKIFSRERLYIKL